MIRANPNISLKMIQRTLLWLTIFLMCSLFMAQSVNACGSCVYAITDILLPNVYLLVSIIIFWFLALSLTSTIQNGKTPSLPSFPSAMMTVVIGFFIALALAGPIPFFFLVLFCILGSMEGLLKKGARRDLKRSIIIINSVVFTLMGLFYFQSIHIKNNQREIDRILKWELLGPAQTYLKRMLDEGEKHLPDFRRVVTKGNSHIVEIAARGLEKYGDPEKDVPLLIDALIRCQKANHCDAKKVESSLRTLSGIELSQGTSHQAWILAWKNHRRNDADKTQL